MGDLDFNELVEIYYQPLYRFAMSLSGKESDASDLTQQTFYLWAARGHQLRDRSKLKSWLATTLHREFLHSRRRQNRFPHVEISALEHELPAITPSAVDRLDGQAVLEALLRVDELYRTALTLFYLEEYSYKDMAEILDVPIGTVMSRLARGKEQLRNLLAITPEQAQSKVVNLFAARDARTP